jgi:hypothetical protein
MKIEWEQNFPFWSSYHGAKNFTNTTLSLVISSKLESSNFTSFAVITGNSERHEMRASFIIISMVSGCRKEYRQDLQWYCRVFWMSLVVSTGQWLEWLVVNSQFVLKNYCAFAWVCVLGVGCSVLGAWSVLCSLAILSMYTETLFIGGYFLPQRKIYNSSVVDITSLTTHSTNFKNWCLTFNMRITKECNVYLCRGCCIEAVMHSKIQFLMMRYNKFAQHYEVNLI